MINKGKRESSAYALPFLFCVVFIFLEVTTLLRTLLRPPNNAKEISCQVISLLICLLYDK